jgi:HlyD family secretion protein
MKIIIRLLILMILLGGASFGVYTYLKDTGLERNGTIKVSGTIEGDNTRLSFRAGSQIEKLLVGEGDQIRAGQVLARLNTDELSKIKANAEAGMKAEEIRCRLAQDDYVRAENLFREGSISAQKRDEAKTKADSTQANVESLKASLDLAVTRLGFADLVSPLNGYILTKSAEQGEVVQPGATVFTAIDLNDLWLTAYINETDLAKLKLNQRAYVTTDTYPHKKYDGRISYISQEAEFTPKYIQTTEERVKLVYRIKIKVDNASLELKPGMPADGYIELDRAND